MFLKFFFFFYNFLFLGELLLARVFQHLVEGQAVVEHLLVLPLLLKLKQKQEVVYSGRGDLNTELVWYLNGRKRLDAKWSSFRMPFEYRTAQPFEYWKNGSHLVFFCTGPVFE